jgi:hypothetical protein
MNVFKNIKKYKEEKATAMLDDKLFALNKILYDMTDRDISNYKIMMENPRNLDERTIKLTILNEYLWCFNKEEIIYLKRIIDQQTNAIMQRYELLKNLNHDFTSEELESELVLLLSNGEFDLDYVQNEWKKYLLKKNEMRLFEYEVEEWQEKLGMTSKQK